jgi:hypothetical protein
VLDEFVAHRRTRKSEGHGLVEPLARAIHSIFGGRSVGPMLKLRQELRAGVPDYRGPGLGPEDLASIVTFGGRTPGVEQPQRLARLVRVTLKRRKSPGRSPIAYRVWVAGGRDQHLGASPELKVPTKSPAVVPAAIPWLLPFTVPPPPSADAPKKPSKKSQVGSRRKSSSETKPTTRVRSPKRSNPAS